MNPEKQDGFFLGVFFVAACFVVAFIILSILF